jgi:tetratricopeptide (TPR) repeat protein
MTVKVVVLLALAACMSPVIPFGGSGKSSGQLQHQTLDKQFPAQLTTLHHEAGPPRKARLRVWADDEYRAQNVHWQHGFDETLDYVNQVLVPMLNVQIEPEYRDWARHAPGAQLDDGLAQLEALDPGDDAVWVLGLTSSLALVSATFDQLGVAHLGGRHLLVRGHADLEERKAFAAAFPDVDREQRDQVLEARRRHKTAAVLLHELAHSLGALHETAPDQVMSPSYSHRAASISDRNRAVMLVYAEDRLAGKPEPRTTARKVIAALEPAWDGWVEGERAQAVAQLQGEVGTAESVGVSGLPASVVPQLRHVQELIAAKDLAGAEASLEPLLVAYPAQVELRVAACELALARDGARAARAVAVCERAAALSPEVETAISVAAARQHAGDAAGARQTLVLAESRTAALPAERAPAVWLTLAETYHQMGALSWAEAAVAHVAPGADRGIAAWATMTRVRYGVPRDGKRWRLAPEDEAAAVSAVRDVVALVNDSKFDAAARAARTAEQRWPALPGLLAARCDLEMRRGAIEAARGLCRRAGAEHHSSWALYLSGILELRAGTAAGDASGTRYLREAIELDPELSAAWRALGKALERTRATAERHQLDVAYQQRFGRPM